ncbi:hypothetical protein J5I14_24135, partial [Escherichia coli]|nr:hypothetical protein [Escherichia coli]
NAHPAKVFAQKQAKTFAVCPRTVVSGRGSDAPCGEGSQKGDGEYRREQKAGPRKTSKPRLPKLKRLWGLKTRERRKQDEYPKYPR